MNEITTEHHRDLATKFRSLLAEYRKAEDLINVGAYAAGSNPRIDEAIQRIEDMQRFVSQPKEHASSQDQTLHELERIMR